MRLPVVRRAPEFAMLGVRLRQSVVCASQREGESVLTGAALSYRRSHVAQNAGGAVASRRSFSHHWSLAEESISRDVLLDACRLVVALLCGPFSCHGNLYGESAA